MTAKDYLDADDTETEERSNDYECGESNGKQNKLLKKKSEKISGSVYVGNRNNERHEFTDDADLDEGEQKRTTSNSSFGIDSDKKDEAKEEEEKSQSARSSSSEGYGDSDNIGENGKEDPRKKLKSFDFQENKMKENLGECSAENNESFHRILLERALNRVCHNGMDNHAEMFLINGDSGVGKTFWITSETNRVLRKMRQDEKSKSAEDPKEDSNDENCNIFPVVCRGRCDAPPRNHSDYDNDTDKHIDGFSSTLNSSTELLCNNYFGMSRPPMHSITEALNNLVRSLAIGDNSFDGTEISKPSNTTNVYGGKSFWKKRIKEALGISEATYLASTGLVPELGLLLDLPGFGNASNVHKRWDSNWDWNSQYKFHRSCLAIRDLLRAVSESHHPVIMVLSHLHQADPDTFRLLNFLLTGYRWDEVQAREAGKLNIDEHDKYAKVEPTEATVAATSTANTVRLKNFLFVGLHEIGQENQNEMLHFLERSVSHDNQQEIIQQHEEDCDVESQEHPRIKSHLTKIHMEGFCRKKVKDFLRSFRTTNEDEKNISEENLEESAEVIHAWTGGKIFYVLQVLKYLKEEGAISSPLSCKWDIDKIKEESRRWNNSVHGLTTYRIGRLPKVVRFVLINASAFRQTFIEFSVTKLFQLLNAAYSNKGRKKKNETEFPFESASELEAALGIACELGFMKRITCRRNRNDSNHRFSFKHDIIRDEAFLLFAKKKKKIEIHLRLGTMASRLAVVPGEGERNRRSRDIYLLKEEHMTLKFLAADQLLIAEEILGGDCNKVALLLVETAEICISKSAFCTAIQYLMKAIGVLERNGGCFTAHNHGMCVRIYLLLGRIHSIFFRGMNETEKAFSEILLNGKNLKDQVMLHSAEIGILVCQKNYQEALEKVFGSLHLLGERFPQSGDFSEIVSRQIEKLLHQIKRTENQELLQPSQCTDKKLFDVMIHLSNLLEICNLCGDDDYRELAIIRMINICMHSGFTPQYSLSFAYYGVILIERAFATRDFTFVKEGYRMGQICEKIASVNNYFGGHSLSVFHFFISHWRRPYRRSLGQMLSIYNAQLESGDYFHIQFTTFVYIQYHLTSGHKLTKLDDNLQLFEILYQDYNMENQWKIQLPQRLVANLLGETSNPFLMYGNTVDDQNSRIYQMEKAGANAAVQYMYFLTLFTSIFFHDHELSKSNLEKIDKEEVLPIWKPWVIFFQCLTDIGSLHNIENKVGRKKLKETIHKQRDQLLDWYNEGAVNCSVMVSLIDAEIMVTNPTGKKPLPTMRIKKYYDDAIAVARQQELKHIEAFCLERASMRFEAAGSNGLSAEYIAKAHRCYQKWNAIAKVADIEEKHASKLELSRQEKIGGAGYVPQKSDMVYDPDQTIGGGGLNTIKSINLKNVAKTAEKVKDIVFSKSSRNDQRNSPIGVKSLRRKFTRINSSKLKKQPETP